MVKTDDRETLNFLDRFLKAWDSVRSRGKKSIYHRYQTIMGPGTTISICCTLLFISLGIVMVSSESLYLNRIGACAGGAGLIGFVTIMIHACLVDSEFDRFIKTITFIETECGFGNFQHLNEKWQSWGIEFVNNIRIPLTGMCQSIASGQGTTFGRDEANRRREELARMYQDILALTKEARKWEDGTMLATNQDLPKDLGGLFPKS